ncbi:YsnF/AvaK domain-containing protein [Erythrobacteraceae bacterium WH01K]|nr:YsnF/AvaK domain-containing protein [Erythrobacteraceae bacterium WH01K]
MQHDKRYEELDELSNYELVNEDQDIRGYPLVNAAGERFGVIDDMLVGSDHDEVVAIRLEDGRCCAVEPLVIHDNVVVYGDAAVAHAKEGVATGHVVEKEVIPIVEEKVEIGKRVAENGRNIGVRTRVVSDTVTEDVTLRDETVSVEKRAVDKRVSAEDADALLKRGEGVVSMTEHDERLVVAKDAVVTDEVVIKKTAADKTERVAETVRKTEVDVDVNENDKRRT